MEKSDLNEVARTIYGFIKKYIPHFYTDNESLADFGEKIERNMKLLIPLPIENPKEYPMEWYERSKRILEQTEIKQNTESNYSEYLDKLGMQLRQLLARNKGAGLETTTHNVEIILYKFLNPQKHEQYVTILKEKLEKIVGQKLQNKEPLTEQEIDFYRILIEKKKETGEPLTEQEQKFYKESKQGRQKTYGPIDKNPFGC